MGAISTISIEHGDKLFWLGRYTERAFTTLITLEKLYDKAIDASPNDCNNYVNFLNCLGLSNSFSNASEFFRNFIFDKNNFSSASHSLGKAYDNGIVLREEISTESLSFLQMAMDKLDKAECEPAQKLRLALLPIRDILYGFWGSLWDHVDNDELAAIIGCGKYVERLDLYLRLNYPAEDVEREFDRMCSYLSKIPKNTPYRYNTSQLSVLVEYVGGDRKGQYKQAISALGKLFEH